MSAIVYVKCPFCNLESWLDRSGNFHTRTKFRCEGCGAIFGDQIVAIQCLRSLVDNDSLQDSDITTVMAKDMFDNNQILLAGQPSPVTKVKLERCAFYVANVNCPFCEQACITRYNALQPHPAQWCPDCAAELVVTIWATTEVGGNLEEWYKPNPEEF
jgi:transposase-like protein